MQLNEVESFIHEHKHLPHIPSEEEIVGSSTNLLEINKMLLRKVEELTLYLLEQNEKISKQDERIAQLEGKQ